MIKRIWIFVIVMLGGLVSCADPIDYSQAEPFVTAGYSGDSGLMPMRDGIKQFNTIHQGHKGYQYEDDGVNGWYTVIMVSSVMGTLPSHTWLLLKMVI